MGRGTAEGSTRITFTESFHLAGLAHHPGSFIVTVSCPGRVIDIEATGQTPQTWK